MKKVKVEKIFNHQYKFSGFVDLLSIKVYYVGDNKDEMSIVKDSEHEVTWTITKNGILTPISGLDFCSYYYISYSAFEDENTNSTVATTSVYPVFRNDSIIVR